MNAAEYYLNKLWEIFRSAAAGFTSIPTTPTETATSADNAAATITYAAAAGQRHALSGIIWSYDGSPTGGRLTVTEGVTMLLDVDITESGPGFLPFERGKSGGTGAVLTITLYAGGAGVIGKLNIINHWTE